MKTALVQLIYNPKRFSREEVSNFRTVYNLEGIGPASSGARKSLHLLDHSFQSLDCEGSLPSSTYCNQSAPAAVNSKIDSNLRICEYIRRTIAKEVSREHLTSSLQATQKAVGNNLLDMFTTSTAKVDEGLKNAIYRFVEKVPTDMAQKKELDGIFNRSIDRWTLSTPFLNEFLSRAQISLQFPCPVGQF